MFPSISFEILPSFHLVNKLRITFRLLLFWYCTSVVLCCCTSAAQYKQDLPSGDINKIDSACYQIGEARDTSAVKFLLAKILDPRVSTRLKFYGMPVNYCRLVALRKISGIETAKMLNQLRVDTPATYFYLKWTMAKGYLKNKNEAVIFYVR